MIAEAAQSGDTVVVGVLVLFGTVVSSFFGYLGVKAARSARDTAASAKEDLSVVHDEVKSPNGTKTADQIYETGKRVLEIRQQMVEIRETQLQIAQRMEAHARTDEAIQAALAERLDKLEHDDT